MNSSHAHLRPISRTRAVVVLALVTVGAVMTLSAGVALATDPIGFTSTPLNRATLTQTVHLNTDNIKFQAREADTDVAISMVKIVPGGNSGWHHHPGVVFATVQSGQLTVLDTNCVETTYATKQVLVETGDNPILVQNKGTTDVIVYATYIAPKGVPLRIDDPATDCPG